MDDLWADGEIFRERSFLAGLRALNRSLWGSGASQSVALLLSDLTNNSAGAIVGTLIFSFVIQFLQFLPGIPDHLETWLLTKEFSSWQGLVAALVDQAPCFMPPSSRSSLPSRPSWSPVGSSSVAT